MLILIAIPERVDAQSCKGWTDSLRSNLASLVLTDDELVPQQTKLVTFIKLRNKTYIIIDSAMQVCQGKELDIELTLLKNSLQNILFKDSMSIATKTALEYSKFVSAKESFAKKRIQFETDELLISLGIKMDTIRNEINRHTAKRIKILSDTMQVHDSVMIALLKYHSPLYTGINWFTQNGLGFGVHYHFLYKKAVSPLAGITLLYQLSGTKHQADTAQNRVGVAVSGGLSIRLSGYNRFGLMVDVAMINSETNLGGRLMMYNQHMAVGIGYSQYLGADITLMIRFHDPRKR